HTQVANQLEFFTSENLAGWIVGCVDDDGFGLVVERRAQVALVECPFTFRRNRWTQFYKPWLGARENRIRPVVLIERFENYDFISNVANCQQRGDHRFG